MIPPQAALFDPGEAVSGLPVCDHYAGVEARMAKSLALQAELGPVFDVTLDCEDGAPVGAEAAHADLVTAMVLSPANVHGRCGVRVHPVGHAAFAADVSTIVGAAASRLAYVMVPKVDGVADVARAAAALDAAGGARVPLHALVETHGGLREVAAIAAHPRIESVSFGLMDFVSAHHGAIPASAMTAAGQFAHPLVLRAKLEISAACHASAKTPSHSVVTELTDMGVVAEAARKASRELGYTRMWSIHPSQIRTIVAAFRPEADEIEEAVDILAAAQDAAWAPIGHAGTLHDRASYRYYWRLLLRARNAGAPLPEAAIQRFFAAPAAGSA